MNRFRQLVSAIAKPKRLYDALKVSRLVEGARNLMVAGRYELALERFTEANQFDICFTPRAVLLFSHCLLVLGKSSQAYKTAEIVEDTLLSDARRYNDNEVRYMIAYGRVIRNQVVEESEELDLPALAVDHSSIELDKVSDDLLATFPLVSHPDWATKGWKG